MKRTLFFATAILLLVGCGEKKTGTTVYPNVLRVFMHEPGHYTFMIREGNQLILCDPPHVRMTKIFDDVPEGKSMWAEVETWEGEQDHLDIYLHIHKVDEIDGGGYQQRVSKTASVQRQTHIEE